MILKIFVNLKLMNYQQMDQTTWVCYQLGAHSYFYGEVGYLDSSGVVTLKENPEGKSKIVRHGFGISVDSNRRYQGQWDKDMKSGNGKMTLEDGSIYEGTFREGCFHQNGKMIWKNGDTYDGQWRRGKMEGAGAYKQSNGATLKGTFKANYFVEDSILRNPQMSEQSYAVFSKQRKQVMKQKERNEKAKHGFFKKIEQINSEKIYQTLKQSNTNNRIPLLISSAASGFSLQNLKELCEANHSKSHVFDLRKAATLKGEQQLHYRNSFTEMTHQVLTQGETLIISLDDSQVTYNEAYYPDLKQFYESNGFNSNLWNRDLMKKSEVHEKIIGKEKINENYSIIVWSKVRLDETTKDDRLRQQLQMRFEDIIPFIRFDIVFVIAK